MRGIIALLTVLLVAGCGTSRHESPRSTIPSVAVADWTMPPSAKFDAYDMPNGQRVEVSFDVTERNGYDARLSAQRDTIAILRQTASSYPSANIVLVSGYGTVKDRYGNTGRREILSTVYHGDTIARINFADIEPGDIWDIKDGGLGYVG